MGGSKTETVKQESRSDPWAPAQPLLTDILGKLRPMVGSTGVNPNESAAIAGLRTNAQQPNAYGGRVGMLADDLFAGGTDRTAMVNDAYSNYRTALEPTARGDFVDPSKNTALQGYLTKAGDDAANRVNSMFAAAGRDFSGAHAKTLGEGVTGATAPILYDAYNRERTNQLGAADKLYGAGGATAGMLSGLDQTALGNRAQGIGVGGIAGALADEPFQKQLAVEGLERGIPQQNLGWLSSLGIPIAGIGGTQSGTSTSTVNDPSAMWRNIIGGGIGGIGLLGQTGAFGSTVPAGATQQPGWLSSALPAMLAFSDIRIKENAVRVTHLPNGLPVYVYNYIGDDEPQIGVMAQDVETIMPEAVFEIDGVKAVNYELLGV